MKRKPALLLALSLYSVPSSVFALGLGDIELRSSLNQPLEARIPVKSWQADELEDLKINVAGREHFDRAGMERVPGLSELMFHVVESRDGSAYIQLSTKADFREPFLDFLIEVSWPQGRVLREYTLLLDPPLYGTALAESLERPSATKIVKASTQSGVEKSSQLTTEQTGTTVSAARSYSSEEPRGKALQATVPTLASPDSAASKEVNRALIYGPTAAGDTLWEMASEIAGDSADDVNQLMLALFRANPGAFLEKNMNLLKKGMVLQIPDQAAISAIESNEALAEVRRHHSLWEEYRQTVAARMDNLPSGALPVAETAANLEGQNEPAGINDQVKLVSAGSANSGVGSGADAAGNIEGLRNELALAVEDAEATKRENQDLRERLGETEIIIKDLRRLIELKDDAISSLQQQVVAANSDFTAPAVESGDEFKAQASDANATQGLASSDNNPASAPSAATNTVPITLEPNQTAASVTAQDVSADEAQPPLAVSPTRSVAIGVGLFGGFLVAGSGFTMWRRRRARTDGLPIAEASLLEGDGTSNDASASGAVNAEGREPIDAGEVHSQANPVEVEADEGEAMASFEADLLDEDPLAEVNVYLAYERFEQAEQLVKEAVEKYPDRQEYKLKLLEIFFASNNTVAFKAHAHALRDAVGDQNPLLEKALTWWRELCSDRDLFGEDFGEQDAVSVGDKEDEEADVSLESSDYLQKEEDVSVGSDTVHLKPGDRMAPEGQTASEMDLDFDLSSDSIGGDNATDRAEGTVDFDLGLVGGDTDGDLQQQDGVDFALDESSHDVQDPADRQEIGGELDLNLAGDDVYSNSAAEGTIDFDLASFDLAGSPASSIDDVVGESSSDETIDLDYPFGDNKDEPPADGLQPVESTKIPEEGTVDFDLGLEDAGEAPRMTMVEIAGSTQGQDTPLDEGVIADSIETGTADDLLVMKADHDGDNLSPPAMEDVAYEQDLSSEHTGMQGAVDSLEKVNTAVGVDLELEPEEVTPSKESEAAAEIDRADEESLGIPATQSHSQDEVLDEWAELDGEPGDEADRTLVLGKEFSQDLDEIQTKLELAQAYIDMGDAEGARSILDEVISEGDNDQKQAAKELIDKMA
jgi:pilus assembly protein FimV